jgi:hypothetical protein
VTRPRLLLAPITVSPTKPLTPSHLKHLLTLDLVRRAASTVADVTTVYHHQSFAGSRQVSGFWAYLERTWPGLECGELTEQQIGDLYVQFHRLPPVPDEELAATVRAAERGWMHPASARLLDIWEGHYRLLGLVDPHLGRTGPECLAQEAAIDLLDAHDLVVDGRPLGAPLYLDACAAGLPLRVAISSRGLPNYLMYFLRQLLPLLPDHDEVLLVYDPELRHDFQLLHHVLSTLGASVGRLEVNRVPLDGGIRSARHGDWNGYLLDEVSRPLLDEVGVAQFRLGIRLYLLAGMGRGLGQSFSLAHLRRWARRAGQLLARTAADPPAADPRAVRNWVRGLTYEKAWADPYRLTTTLLRRDSGAPLAGVIRGLYGAEAAGPSRNDFEEQPS